MNDFNSFSVAGSSQQQYQHTYDLWNSSAYYNINDLSARNLIVTESTECNSICDEKKEDIRDSKNRRIISKDSLYQPLPEDAENFRESVKPSPSPETVDWTTEYWLKAGRHAGAKLSSQTTSRQPVQNSFQKKFNKALSQPLNIDDKAANMMAKMGWQGGALGKSGAGIVEPIVPNTVYATKTIGFGQPEPIEKSKKKQKQKKKQNDPKNLEMREMRKLKSDGFIKNVMLHILDFVKNDYEVELVFDSKLKNYERKKIHCIVEKVRDAEDIVAINDGTLANVDIYKDIIKYNNYNLRTESEGVMPNRALCVYKEPPDHMYVVTHHDLRYEPEKPDKPNQQTDMQIDTAPNDLINESNEQTQCVDEVNEVNESRMDEDDEVVVVSSDDSCDEGGNNSKSANDNEKNEILTENVVNKETDIHKEENKIKTKKVKSYYITKKGLVKYKMIDVKVDYKPLNVDKKSKFRKVTMESLATEKNPFLKSILSVQKCDGDQLTKADLKNQILEYFSEFAQEKLYTEFKFLGCFNEIEAEAINEFINNLWMCLNDGDYLNDEILCIMKDSECGFAIGMHANGSALIYKTQKSENVT